MKHTIKSITITVFFVALLAVTAVFFGKRTGIVAPVQAQELTQEGTGAHAESFRRWRPRRCGPHSVSGSYAYQASGFVTQAIPQAGIPAGPFAVNSLLTLSNGRFSFKGTQSFNGTIVPANGAGNYTVNEDCTGRAMDDAGTPYNFVVADDGNEIRIILTVPGTVVAGVAKRL